MGCAVYDPIGIDLRALRDQGVHGVRIDFAESKAAHLGHIRIIERSWLFGSCTALGSEAIDELASEAVIRGADQVSELKFRGKWTWLKEPVCRRNFTWALLLLPLALPVPLSVEVSGEAYDTQAPKPVDR